MKKAVSISGFLFLILFFACNKDKSKTYDCINGSCESVENGDFTNLEDCFDYCYTGNRYDCVNGLCEESANGQFSSISACASMCSGSAGSYTCVNGNCQYISDESGPYATITICQTSCSSSSNDSSQYNCVYGLCEQVSSGAYNSLSECRTNCGYVTITVTNGNGVTDIDGNQYTTLIYGNGQEWMAENLKVSKYNDGTPIPQLQSATDWVNNNGGWCINDDIPNYESIFGKIYDGLVVDFEWHGRNVCPTGWHVPSPDEWDELFTYLGGRDFAGGKLKATGTTYWDSPNNGATNQSQFSALPGGLRNESSNYSALYIGAHFWADQPARYNGLQFTISAYRVDINAGFQTGDFNYGKNIRCLKD